MQFISFIPEAYFSNFNIILSELNRHTVILRHLQTQAGMLEDWLLLFTNCRIWVQVWQRCPHRERSDTGGGLLVFSGRGNRRRWLQLASDCFLHRFPAGWTWGLCCHAGSAANTNTHRQEFNFLDIIPNPLPSLSLLNSCPPWLQFLIFRVK